MENCAVMKCLMYPTVPVESIQGCPVSLAAAVCHVRVAVGLGDLTYGWHIIIWIHEYHE